MSQKIAVHYGAGNIGRGFIGPLLVDAGYKVIFADVVQSLIEAINKEKEFNVIILGTTSKTVTVKGVSGVNSIKAEEIDPVLLEADLITTSVGPNILPRIAPTIAKAIAARRAKGDSKPLNIIACENLVGATDKLKESIFKALEANPEDLEFAKSKVGFANCSVDRIVPPFKSDKMLDVGVEEFFEWVVNQTTLVGPPLKVEGMKLTDNLAAYNERKLFTLNTGHALTAYLGTLKGYSTIDEAIKDEQIRSIVIAAMKESGQALIKKHAFSPQEHEAYINKIIVRFENPNIKDELIRVGRQPLRKLSPTDRIIGPVKMATGYGMPCDNLLTGAAAALHFTPSEDEEGVKLGGIISDKGLDHAITEATSLQAGTPEFEKIKKEHATLASWKKA